MKARVAFLVAVAAVLLAAAVYGLKAGQRAIARAQQETRQKIAQAVQEAQSKAQAAALDAERQAQTQEGSKPADAPTAKGSDEPILVKSITIDGLEKAAMTPEDLADIEIELDDRPAGLGRPTATKVRMSSLMQPVSPLTLYPAEVQRMSEAVVEAVQKRGYMGILVLPHGLESDDVRPADGNCHWSLSLLVIEKLEIEDRRPVKEPPADLEAIRAECPLKVGDHIIKPKLDECAAALRRRFSDANVTMTRGQAPEGAVLTIVLGHAQSK